VDKKPSICLLLVSSLAYVYTVALEDGGIIFLGVSGWTSTKVCGATIQKMVLKIKGMK
jgi:hypothetical protein